MMIQNHTLDIIAASLLEKNLCLYNALVMTDSSVQKEHQEPSCVRQLMQKGNFWKPPADCCCLFLGTKDNYELNGCYNFLTLNSCIFFKCPWKFVSYFHLSFSAVSQRNRINRDMSHPFSLVAIIPRPHQSNLVLWAMK